MLAWSTIIYGAILSGVLAAVAAALLSPTRRVLVTLTVGLTTLLAPTAWNAILRATHAHEFFTDAPLAVLPASWQDTGSGVFTIALTALALGLGPLAATGRRTALLALVAGLIAFAVDVYLY
ncbi:hypothetical protein SAMN05661080_00513 [Modestobacter sp. DSM 44400]|uniref:hypothetical protein n=1 Tax=Modestobacter sp. DSM 44400 TaxID=1550230 RepID=UPI00089DA340|nr:hypothetical protein [Modestobacter sp. DSM 44400]SDX59772.1 hypothetical protein SAMN05661080_00513 [Modestobacter sp. DSM 44400]